jgi:hypothetical protein
MGIADGRRCSMLYRLDGFCRIDPSWKVPCSKLIVVVGGLQGEDCRVRIAG